MEKLLFMQGMKLIETVHRATKGEKASFLTPEQTELYKALLDDIPGDQFITGINMLLRERVYSNIPSPGEIREFCLGMKDNELSIKILTAKKKIKDAIGLVGVYNSVAFDDPVIHLVIRDIGGWITLCKMDYEELESFLKWDLPKLYKAYSSRKNTNIPVEFNGIGIEKRVRYIGDRQQAEKWILAYKKANNLIENKEIGLLEA
ncbi:hypothetical protein IX317_000372 [Fusobacterium sp. DD29]|uniref:DUF6475 domain-containing protein n=1 Tax=unclassified Fusobacterium TaxID=2648384 RepID=UPI001B8D4F06|nr:MULTISPECIES: DUF6475 domain-containing protein [unclassified Fusobacterium]MBR8748713.1 hypothetical protein [Fusobacterium sp. DD29]MBR8760935.1 hypothetical protein [Fusobacterium sp. DD25]MBR8766992.1 hypothetical protein [Fusobacterium sp. DD43]MBR8770993.1 hypothetical protein [Fusobacterium sp. DD40]MBR8775268.1 hypothetical protein [Fusobacterium sp. DD17]